MSTGDVLERQPFVNTPLVVNWHNRRLTEHALQLRRLALKDALEQMSLFIAQRQTNNEHLLALLHNMRHHSAQDNWHDFNSLLERTLSTYPLKPQKEEE
jgi:hypothetical protein